MRQNKLKQMFRDGRAAIGAAVPFPVPEAVEFLGLVGFDFVFIDAEHGTIGPELCLALVRAAELTGIEAVVRVPRNDPAVILSYLETGAWSIQVPHVNTAAAARAAIEAVKYPPLGIRGAGSTTRAARFGLELGAAEYFAYANEQTLVIPMVEEPAAVEHVDEIVAVEGLEALFIGNGDLSLTMGYPGQRGHPAVLAAIERVERAVRPTGIALGGVGGDAAANNELIQKGYLFTLNSPGGLFAAACRSFLSGIQR